MNAHRRDFLHKISSVAALAASGSVLKQDAEAALKSINSSLLFEFQRDRSRVSCPQRQAF
jgi:hypothetical protein